MRTAHKDISSNYNSDPHITTFSSAQHGLGVGICLVVFRALVSEFEILEVWGFTACRVLRALGLRMFRELRMRPIPTILELTQLKSYPT